MVFFDGSTLKSSAFVTKKFKFDASSMFDGRRRSEYKESLLHEGKIEFFSRTVEPIPIARPILVERTPIFSFEGLTDELLNKSLLKSNEKKMDSRRPKSMELEMSRRSGRVGFGKEMRMIGMGRGYSTSVEIKTVRVVPTIESYFIRYLTQQNRLHELASIKKSSSLHWNPPSLLLKLLDSLILAVKQGSLGEREADQRIFGLCEALLLPSTVENKDILQRRRFGDWLRKDLEKYAPPSSLNTSSNSNSSNFSLIFHHLINGATGKAEAVAKRDGNYNLSLLISLYKGVPPGAQVQAQVAKQLTVARSNKRSELDPFYEKILQLLSGSWKISEQESRRSSHPSQPKESSLARLNCLQVLGVIIWYWAKPTTTMAHVTGLFEEMEKVLEDEDLYRFA